MPMPGYGVDPETQLQQLLQSPQYSGGGAFSEPTSEAQNAYADQPNKEAILHYLTTGQMPTTVRQQPAGLLGHLGTMLGLRTEGPRPISQYTQDRATQAGKLQGQVNTEQQLREFQSLQPFAQQYGTDAARQAAHVIDSKLEGAFPSGMKGKGEIQQQGLEQKYELGQLQNDTKMLYVQSQAALADARAAAASGNAAVAEQKAQIAWQLKDLAERKLNEGPMNNMLKTMTESIDRREGDVRKRMDAMESLGPVREGDPRMAKLQAELDGLEDQRLRMATGGDTKAYQLLHKMLMPEGGGATKPPAANGGPRPLPKGIFGGGAPAVSGALSTPEPKSTPAPPRMAEPEARATPTPKGKKAKPVRRPAPRGTPKPRYD